MADEWQVVEGTGWIALVGFGRMNPRRDDVGGGRQYFTAKLHNDEYATATGSSITGGPETWHF
jgi:hypothetical protein